MNTQEMTQKMIPVFKRYNIKSAELFGSFARGEETDVSDVDLLISTISPIGVYRVFSLKEELESVLNRTVDVVFRDAINPHLSPYIKKDLQLIYEKG